MSSTHLDHEALRKLLDMEAIKRAVLLYARGVDRRDWDLVRQAYHPDAFDDHGSYKGGVEGLIEWISRRHAHIDQSMHLIGNCVVDLFGADTALCETSCLSIQRYGEAARETIKTWLGNEALAAGKYLKIEITARYVDHFERRDGTWRIASRTVVFEEVKAVQDTSRLSGEWALAQRDRSDPLWIKLRGVESTS